MHKCTEMYSDETAPQHWRVPVLSIYIGKVEARAEIIRQFSEKFVRENI